MKNIFLLLIIGVVIWGCDPVQAPDIELGQAPGVPEFSIDFLDSNTVVVTDLSNGNFTRVWDFGENAEGDRPIKQTSTAIVDTVEYLKAGDYTITLYVSAASGGGTNQSSKAINIAQDGQVSCNDQIALLTGDCLPAGKCWTFSTVAGAVSVGPSPGDASYFSSPQDGLVPEQYDDSFCFYAENVSFLYMNSGETINPWNGYQAEPYTPPTDHTWTYSPGTGNGGKDQIILTEGSFLGVWDADNVYDIVSLTETELIVQCEKVDDSAVWFQLTFVAL